MPDSKNEVEKSEEQIKSEEFNQAACMIMSILDQIGIDTIVIRKSTLEKLSGGLEARLEESSGDYILRRTK